LLFSCCVAENAISSCCESAHEVAPFYVIIIGAFWRLQSVLSMCLLSGLQLLLCEYQMCVYILLGGKEWFVRSICTLTETIVRVD
jgi:hypothetical protein